MFEHLTDSDAPYTPPPIADPLRGFKPWDKAAPVDIVDGQFHTAEFLTSLGVVDANALVSEKQAQKTGECARDAFTHMAAGSSAAEQRKKLLELNSPPAVRELVGMLTAYDWAFVEQAKELRGYAVKKILDDCENPDARHRLRALEMLGKITEVALFTERTHIIKEDLTDEALEAKIKSKLDKFRHVIDVTSTDKEVHTIEHAPDQPDAPRA